MKRFFFFLMVMVHVANLAAEKDMKVLNADDYKHYIERFNKDDEELYVQYIPNESVWNFLKQNIPLLVLQLIIFMKADGCGILSI